MNFIVQKKKIFTLISLPKILDSSVSVPLKKKLDELIADGVKNIIFDLNLSEYCDSSGLSAILKGNRLSNNVGGVCLLVNVCEVIEKLITISQLAEVLKIRTDLDKAEDFILRSFVN